MEIKRPIPRQYVPSDAKKIFSGFIFDLYQWQQKMFDGTKETFEILKRPDTVNIIPITTDKKIIITHQEQPGGKPFIGTPGGRIDEGEKALEAAKRELLEETGYASDTFILWDVVQPYTKIDWMMYTFIAKDCRKVQGMHLDAGEKITLDLVSFEEFMKAICKPNFRDKEIALKILREKEIGRVEKIKELFLQ